MSVRTLIQKSESRRPEQDPLFKDENNKCDNY